MPAAKAKSPRPRPPAKRLKKPERALNAALAAASWGEADLALAEALACADEMDNAPDASMRDAARALLQQALARAARKRGLTRHGELGAREAFDSAQHELAAPSGPAQKTVLVVARSVARGEEVLVKARVAPLVRVRRP